MLTYRKSGGTLVRKHEKGTDDLIGTLVSELRIYREVPHSRFQHNQVDSDVVRGEGSSVTGNVYVCV